MAYRAKVLRTKANKFEAKKLQVHSVTKERVSSLETLLQDVYASRRPKPADYVARQDLVHVFNEIAKEIYGKSKDIPVVVEFGSFVMDLFSTTSDLDLSVNFSGNTVGFPREKKIQTLRKFARKLYAIQSQGHVSGVLPITTAKVPILKCVDCGTGVECDISVENRDGILKSQIIHIISSIDERFQKLSFLMKIWAKAHNINSSKDKTLNSLSIILLVVFHLQTRNPPILPPFSALFKDGTDISTLVKTLPDFMNYGKRNRESVAELFVTLLIKLSSVEKLWAKGLCASTFDASWTSKTYDSKVACISVEDFTDRSQNVARAVGQVEVKKIYKCIDLSIGYIFSFMDGDIGVQLRDVLFGQDGNIPTSISRNLNPYQAHKGRTGKRRKQAAIPNHHRVNLVNNRMITNPLEASVSAKRMRTGGDGLGGICDATWRAAAHVISTQLQHAVAPYNPLMNRQQQPTGGWAGVSSYAPGWGGTQQTSAGGWAGTQQTSAGGWGGMQQPSAAGWGGAHQRTIDGWGRNHQHQDNARGWGWNV